MIGLLEKKYVFFFLKKSLPSSRKKKIAKIKNNGCKVVAEPLKIQDVSR